MQIKTEHQNITEVVIGWISTTVSFIKSTKAYLLFVTFFSWLFSTYDLRGILLTFCLATVLNTLTKINANAQMKGIKFNPLRYTFWREIKAEGLKKMGRKIFLEYSVYIILAFAIDTWVFKNALHFDVMNLKLNIPTFCILFFTGIEIRSVFENMENSGKTNYLKLGIKYFENIIPNEWKKLITKTNNKSKRQD